MTEKDEYYNAVYKIIEEYDFGYVAQYSEDEYSNEVRIIIQRLPKCPTIESIQTMLLNLFAECFTKNHIVTDLNLYKSAAQKLYNLEVME
jgi:hypothetical protein